MAGQNRNRILLVFPTMGMAGSLVRHMPLSLLYALIDSRKAGFDVDIVDLRLVPKRWEEAIASKLTSDTILVGLSVMTGAPIKCALEVSRWVKRNYPHVKVVWGGPHATFNAIEILSEEAVDYAISGYGSKPLSLLAKHLCNRDATICLSDVPGLVYRLDGKIQVVPPANVFEVFDYRDIPYSLIERDIDLYGQLDSRERIFSLYSAMGCPYKCAFCSSPGSTCRKYSEDGG